MSFSERTKNIALAIVKIFETGKPLGNYSAVAVLDDGAGISYGTSQFTHKSGSLELVLRRYKVLKGFLPDVLETAWPLIDTPTTRNIATLSKDSEVKAVLKALGSDPLMQQAQREIAWEKYLKPAIDACEGSDFTLPLSLAVIYDSMNHGSYAKIRDQVRVKPLSNGSMKPEEYEQEWITEYVRRRDRWLESVPRLAKTGYRTDFFLAQIAKGNWNLDLPMNVHGYHLTESSLIAKTSAAPQTLSEDKQVPAVTPQDSANTPPSNASGQTLKAEITPDGGVKVESQEGAPQPQERIAVVQTQPQKWSNRVTTKITGVVTGNALFQWIWSQMEKLQGLEIHDSVWIIVSLTIAIGSLLWIVHEIVNTWRENKRQEKIDELLVKENSTANNLVQLIPSDETDLYRARGFKIITRGEKA